MKTRYGKLFTMIAAVLLLAFAFCGAGFSAAHAENYNVSESKKLSVAFPIVQGISEIDENGNHTGILVDYLNEIAKYTDWEYDYILADNDAVTGEFLDGDYDLLGGTYYREDYEKYFAYPKYSMGNSRATILCRKDDDTIKSFDLSSINGKTIGVYEKADEKIRRLKVFLYANNLNCEIRYFTPDEMSIKNNLYDYLRAGTVDLLLGNITDLQDDFALFSTFDDQPYYIVAQPGRDDIVDGLNYALEKILDINPGFAEEVYEKNFGTILNSYTRLNQSELEYIERKKAVTVAIVNGWHPFYCVNESNVSHNGLIPDILDEIAAYTGLEFHYAFVDTYSDMIDKVRRGEADLSGCYFDSDEDAFSLGLARTEAYTSLNNTVIKNKSVDFPGDDLIGGVLENRNLPKNITAKEVRYYATPKAGLDAVQRGEIDFFSGLSAVIESEYQSGKYPDLTFVSSANFSVDVTFALDRPVDTELYSVMNKALRSITAAKKENITNKNIVSEGVVSSATLAEIIAANPAAFVAIICAVFAVVSAGVVVFVRFRYRAKIMATELEKSEARSRAKSDFLSQMSHEIRTPMNAIVGLTDLVGSEPDLQDGVREKLAKIRTSSDYLLSLISDILDMSRIENNKMELEAENFSLNGLLDEIDKMTGVLVERKGIELECRRRIVHDTICADPIRLRQVIVNLISNAVKFTASGKKITLDAAETAGGDGKARYMFAVIDQGVGIAPENRERIFKAFEQAGTNYSKSEGTGLGLAISSSIVRAMGGELLLESEVGQGSRFWFEVEFSLAETKPAAEEAAPAGATGLDGMRVLLAEDNDLNAEIAQELLEMHGAAVTRARNGKEAVDLFVKSASGDFTLILMDIRMPIMDGLAATREIRASGHPDAATVPVVAMTANSFVEDKRAAEAAGMNGFVPKPVDMELLMETIAELTAKRAAPGADTAGGV